MENNVQKGKRSIGNILGSILTFLSFVVLGFTGIWGVIIEIKLLSQISSSVFFYIGAIILFPITVFATPLYALFKWGEWLPTIVIFGGALTWWSLGALGGFIKND